MKTYIFSSVGSSLSRDLASMLEGATIIAGVSAATAVRQGIELWSSRVLRMDLEQWTEIVGDDASAAVRRLGLHAGVVDGLPAHLATPPVSRKITISHIRGLALKTHIVQEKLEGPRDMFSLDDIAAIDEPTATVRTECAESGHDDFAVGLE